MSDKLAKLCIDDVCKTVDGTGKGLLVNIAINGVTGGCPDGDILPRVGTPDKTFDEIAAAYKQGIPVTYHLDLETGELEQPRLASMVAYKGTDEWDNFDPETFHYSSSPNGDFPYMPNGFEAVAEDPSYILYIWVTANGSQYSTHTGSAAIDFTPSSDGSFSIAVCRPGDIFDWENFLYNGIAVSGDLDNPPDGLAIYNFSWSRGGDMQ